MSEREKYVPGPASGARVDKNGDNWTLILVRELRHPPTRVWQALTDPAHLSEWAPFDSDRNLGKVGPMKLSAAGKTRQVVTDGSVKRADEPHWLEYNWGGQDLRWQLEPLGAGTRLTLWHNIDRRFIAWGAAGWHICFDVLDRMLAGAPLGRIIGGDAAQHEWPRLIGEYAQAFGVEAPSWSATKDG